MSKEEILVAFAEAGAHYALNGNGTSHNGTSNTTDPGWSTMSLWVLGVSPAVTFFAGMIGSFLVRFLSPDVGTVLTSFARWTTYSMR